MESINPREMNNTTSCRFIAGMMRILRYEISEDRHKRRVMLAFDLSFNALYLILSLCTFNRVNTLAFLLSLTWTGQIIIGLLYTRISELKYIRERIQTLVDNGNIVFENTSKIVTPATQRLFFAACFTLILIIFSVFYNIRVGFDISVFRDSMCAMICITAFIEQTIESLIRYYEAKVIIDTNKTNK